MDKALHKRLLQANMPLKNYSNLIVAVIPARFKSTRFPGKPLAILHDKPLICKTVENAQACTLIDHIIVATDDERIANTLAPLGIDVQMTDETCATGTDRIAQVIERRANLLNAQLIVNIQGDEPCMPHEAIETVIHSMQTKQADIGTAVVKSKSSQDFSNPNIVKCVRRPDGFALYFSRSPLPGAKQYSATSQYEFFRHIGLYIFRPQSLLKFAHLQKTPLEIKEDLEMLRALEHGMSILTEEISCSPPGVDVPEDIEKVIQWKTK